MHLPESAVVPKDNALVKMFSASDLSMMKRVEVISETEQGQGPSVFQNLDPYYDGRSRDQCGQCVLPAELYVVEPAYRALVVESLKTIKTETSWA